MELPNQYQLLQKIFQESRWSGKDQFPSDNLWADEAEKWLRYIKSKGQFEKFLPRLRDLPAQRDETLSEIKAAYFIETYAECPITSWEPPGDNGKLGEFCFSLSGQEVFCEVKSPGWEQAIVESQGIKSPRLDLPKFIPGVEVGSFANWPYVRASVLRAYPKFPDNTPTLLILVDDFKVCLTDDPLGMPKALYESGTGCFMSNQFTNLGAIAALNVQNTGKIEYRFSVYHNPMALKPAVIPREIFGKYKQFFNG